MPCAQRVIPWRLACDDRCLNTLCTYLPYLRPPDTSEASFLQRLSIVVDLDCRERNHSLRSFWKSEILRQTQSLATNCLRYLEHPSVVTVYIYFKQWYVFPPILCAAPPLYSRRRPKITPPESYTVSRLPSSASLIRLWRCGTDFEPSHWHEDETLVCPVMSHYD